MTFTPATGADAGRKSGESRRRTHADRLADDAFDRFIEKVAAERPPLTDKQRHLLLALLGGEQK